MWKISYQTTRFVSRHRGALPVVLACPHDGSKAPPHVPERSGSALPASCDFTKTRDLNTRAITTGVAQRLLDLCGESPYVVIAEFDRKRIDANRAPACAYEVEAAQPFFHEYHQTLRGFVDGVRAESGGPGLLFDIHGTAGIASDPADLYLGTEEGDSIARLLEIDPHAMSRRRSLSGLLTAAGYAVKLNAAPLGGGYTIVTYGTSHVDGIDAIQVEIAAPIRKSAQRRAALIEHLAYAIRTLVDRYASVTTLAAVQSLDMLDAGAVQHPLGQFQRRAGSTDARIRLGGAHGHRGRLELRHDPTTPRRAGVLVLYDETGKDHFLWVDNHGVLRISPSDPGSSIGAGKIVGEPP
jgi:N-formylglutamate amidohydrolase